MELGQLEFLIRLHYWVILMDEDMNRNGDWAWWIEEVPFFPFQLQSHYQGWIAMLKIYVCLWLISGMCGLALYKPSNIVCQNKLLFNSNSYSLSFQSFVITFSRSFAQVPSVSYGINNYQTGSRFYYQNIQTTVSQSRRDGFILDVNPIQITTIYKFSISLLAVDDQENFVVLARTYLNPLVYSNHKGTRITTIRQSFNFTQSNVNGILMIRGFYIQSISQYQVSSQFTSIGNRNFSFLIGTLSDCSINRLDLSLLFYYPNLINDDYVISLNQRYCFTNIEQSSSAAMFLQTDVSVVLFGLSGFGGMTPKSLVNIGWTTNNVTNSSLIFNFNTNNLVYLCYNFIQIFALKPKFIPPPPSNNTNPATNATNATSTANTTNSTNISAQVLPPAQTPTTDSGPGDNSGLMMTIIAICCTVIVVLVIICAARRVWLSKFYEKETLKLTKKQLSLATIHELPSINF